MSKEAKQNKPQFSSRSSRSKNSGSSIRKKALDDALLLAGAVQGPILVRMSDTSVRPSAQQSGKAHRQDKKHQKPVANPALAVALRAAGFLDEPEIAPHSPKPLRSFASAPASPAKGVSTKRLAAASVAKQSARKPRPNGRNQHHHRSERGKSV
jgi:hypothetical protein